MGTATDDPGDFSHVEAEKLTEEQLQAEMLRQAERYRTWKLSRNKSLSVWEENQLTKRLFPCYFKEIVSALDAAERELRGCPTHSSRGEPLVRIQKRRDDPTGPPRITTTTATQTVGEVAGPPGAPPPAAICEGARPSGSSAPSLIVESGVAPSDPDEGPLPFDSSIWLTRRNWNRMALPCLQHLNNLPRLPLLCQKRCPGKSSNIQFLKRCGLG